VKTVLPTLTSLLTDFSHPNIFPPDPLPNLDTIYSHTYVKHLYSFHSFLSSKHLLLTFSLIFTPSYISYLCKTSLLIHCSHPTSSTPLLILPRSQIPFHSSFPTIRQAFISSLHLTSFPLCPPPISLLRKLPTIPNPFIP